MSTLIVPHRTKVARHTVVPFLWRATCSCGWSAFAGNEGNANGAAQQHLFEEEPFPEEEAKLLIDPDNVPEHLK